MSGHETESTRNSSPRQGEVSSKISIPRPKLATGQPTVGENKFVSGELTAFVEALRSEESGIAAGSLRKSLVINALESIIEAMQADDELRK